MLSKLIPDLFASSRRSLGWQPSPADARDHEFGRLGLSALKLPDHPNILPRYWRVPFDQDASNSCTGNAASGALCAHMRYVNGDASLLPSARRGWYYNGRALRARLSGGGITDTGAYLRDVWDAGRRMGVPFERDLPFDVRAINKQPPFGAYVSGHGYRGGSYVRIFETGQQKSLAIRTALAHGFPVVIGTPVDKAFAANRDGDVRFPDMTRDIGGHAMFLLDYAPRLFGRAYMVANSWGLGWGAAGFAWMPEEWIEWSRMEAWIVYGFEVKS